MSVKSLIRSLGREFPDHVAEYESLQHFIAHSPWQASLLLRSLGPPIRRKADGPNHLTAQRNVLSVGAGGRISILDVLIHVCGDRARVVDLEVFPASESTRRPPRGALELSAEMLSGIDALYPMVNSRGVLGDLTRAALSKSNISYLCPLDGRAEIHLKQGNVRLERLTKKLRARHYSARGLISFSGPGAPDQPTEHLYVRHELPFYWISSIESKEIVDQGIQQMRAETGALTAMWSSVRSLGFFDYRGQTEIGHEHHMALSTLVSVAVNEPWFR